MYTYTYFHAPRVIPYTHSLDPLNKARVLSYEAGFFTPTSPGGRALPLLLLLTPLTHRVIRTSLN